MHSCRNKPEKFYTEKKTKHKPSGYSLFINCSFDATKNKLDCYKGEVCMEKFCKDLRQHAENACYETQKFVTYAKKYVVLIKMMKMHLTNTIKSEIIVITQEKLEELLIVFVI